MPEVVYKTEKNTDIAPYFYYFDALFTLPVLKFFENFWEQNFEIKLVSITKNPKIKQDKISLGEIYFTKSTDFQGKNVLYRLNANLIKILIEQSLGNQKPFNLKSLTQFEIYLLSDFCKKMNDFLQEKFIPLKNIEKKDLKSDNNWNLTYLIRYKDEKLGKFVISIPEFLVRPVKFESKTEFSVSDDFHTKLRVKVGSTRLALTELKNLSRDDIILLENSLINKMTIKSGKFLYDFKVSPDPNIMIELNEEEHDIGSRIMDNKNMWDDIQIEVSAEFDKVKMTLGELKQISSGMVIDLADAFNGKISLVVEDKTVAKGNLVIINERYGVKLTEVFSEPKQQPQIKQEIKEINKPTEEEEKNGSDDDFDYSDFEDDEN